MTEAPRSSSTDSANEPELAAVVHRNIRALVDARERLQVHLGFQQRVADKITAFTGSMTFVYVHATFFAFWFCANLGLLGLRPFDPYPFVMLAMIASVEAIFLSTFVLISQNRMQRLADQRADLNLQISLLAEHEVTRLIRMVDAMAIRIGIASDDRQTLEELKHDVHPETLLREMEQLERDKGK